MSQLASPLEIYWISGSPFAWRVLLTAEVKGIPYEGKLLDASKGELKNSDSARCRRTVRSNLVICRYDAGTL
jgi:hypothetical protein